MSGPRTAWFHCFAGTAGDMTMASLVHAGADPAQVAEILGGLPLDGYALGFEPVLRCGIAATHADVAVIGTRAADNEETIVAFVTARGGLLDVGTGSGILLLAALALGASHGTGVDIDPLSVAAATENARRNGVADRVEILAGSLPLNKPAPLVMANLVATLHIELAPLLVGAMAPGGRLLTSGMFISRADEAIAALQAGGATLVERWEEGEWVAAEFSDGRATLDR